MCATTARCTLETMHEVALALEEGPGGVNANNITLKYPTETGKRASISSNRRRAHRRHCEAKNIAYSGALPDDVEPLSHGISRRNVIPHDSAARRLLKA